MKNARSPTQIYNYYQAMLINRIIKMFEWKNLPDTIDVDYLNYTLITNGNICFTKINNKLYALSGNPGGEPNEYYFPTLYIIANPVLGSKTVNIDVDGVVIYNSTIDKFTQPRTYPASLNTLVDITAQRLTEITISALTAAKNIRAAIFISAKDDETKQAAEIALKRIFDGEPAVIFKDKIIESLNITINPAVEHSAQALAELREDFQFALAQFFNSIGINANYNMKRERLNTSEVNANTDSLLINIADMLYQRQTGVKKVNKMENTNISVDFSAEWKKTEALQKDSFDTETAEQDKPEETPEEKESDESADS